MPTHPRPDYVRDIERASRHRTQDAFNSLIQILQSVPRDDLQYILTMADPNATLSRRGLSHQHAIKIATVMVRCVQHLSIC